MSDIPAAPPPPSGTPPVPTAAAGAPAPSDQTPARAPTLPPDLARAAAGTTVDGEVRAASPDGRVTVRTDQGEIRLELGRNPAAQSLRPGTPVTIEVRNTTARPPVVLVAVRGAVAQGAVTQGAVTQGAATPGGTAQAASPVGSPAAAIVPAVTTGTTAPAPTVPLTVGRIVQATVVPGPASGPGAVGVAGTPQTATPTASLPPAGAPPPGTAPGTAPGTTGQALPPSAPAGTGSPAGTAATPLAGTVRPVPPPPAGPITTAASPAAPGQTTPGPTTPGPTAPVPAGAPPGATATAPAPGATSPGTALPNAAVQNAATANTAASNAASQRAALPGTPAAAAVSSAATAAGLPNGAVLTVRIAAVAGSAAQPEGAPRAVTGLVERTGQSAVPARIAGQIAGVTAAGRPVVQSPVGYLALDAKADLRLGTAIALDVLASRGGPSLDRAAPLPVLAREWPALDAAMRLIEEQVGPAAARQMVDSMPRPGPQMTATLLFFMTALRAGDVRGWLGRNAVQTLEKAGKGGLLGSLDDDFKTLQRAAEPAENGWRSFLIPIAWDDKRPIRLLTRRERRDERDGRSGKPGTAFLVDLDLSNIGPFRLDGLVRNELVDLLIRTTRPLPTVMRHDIKALFDGTLERTGIIGRLTFRASPVMPPLPVDLEVGATGDTTTVTV